MILWCPIREDNEYPGGVFINAWEMRASKEEAEQAGISGTMANDGKYPVVRIGAFTVAELAPA